MADQPGTTAELRRLRAVVDLADDLEPAERFHRLVGYCVELLGAPAAAVVLAEPDGELRVAAASDVRSRRLTQQQLEAGEGPALETARTGAAVRASGLRETDDRWPGFATEALGAGFDAVIALPLRRSETIGAVILFGRGRTDAEAALDVGQAFADAATVGALRERAIRNAKTLARQLQRALDSRIVIEQAKGVLAQAGDLPVDEVFTRLRDYSRRHSAPLRDVAEEVVRRSLTPGNILDPHAADRPTRFG